MRDVRVEGNPAGKDYNYTGAKSSLLLAADKHVWDLGSGVFVYNTMCKEERKI